jgi:predicted metal-dependent peptidase
MKFDFDTHLFALLRDEPFLASFSLRLDKVRDRNIRTCGVRLNGDTLKYEFFYNPDFMNSLTPREATGVMKHEFYHLILGHVTSRFSKDRQENMMMWNIAADLAINSYLQNELPQIACVPGRDKFADVPPFQSAEWYYDFLQQNEEDFKDILDSTTTLDDHGHWGESETSDGATAAQQVAGQRLDNDLKEVSQQASKSGGWGSVPNHIRSVVLDRAKSHEVDWRKTLRYFCVTSKRASRSSSIKRLNRRYPYIHPGKKSSRVANIAISVDQSGSVTDEQLSQIASELNKLAEIVDFTVIPFDHEVVEEKVFQWARGRKMKLERVAYGGTNFDAPTDFVNERVFDGHIVLTDLMASPPKRSKCKRIWINIDSYYRDKKTFGPSNNEKVIHI